MKIESKYDKGQTLWTIEPTYKKCECCGQEIKDKYCKVSDRITIDGVNVFSSKIYYSASREGEHNIVISENDIDKSYFTTREIALAECERLNGGGKCR